MKKIIILILAMAAFCNVFAQSNYPFDVKITGTGNRNLIFIPGLACPGEVWDQTVEHYKMNSKCYVLTFHGFAGTKADTSTSYKHWEESITKYITENKIKDPIIIGHSIGGGMAMLLAADHPSIISKIIVVDALPCLGALSNPSFVADKDPDCSMYVKQFQSMSPEQYYSMQQKTMPSLMADTAHLKQAIQWSVDSDRKAIAEIYCQFLNTDMRDRIATIKCESLVLLEAPFVNMKTEVEKQFSKMKSAQLKYSDKALHFIMYDDTKWYLSQMDAFLK